MKRWLPLCFAALAAALPVEGGGQYLYSDTNANQVCGSLEYVWGTDVAVGVYLDTNQSIASEPVVCTTGEPLSMRSYSLVFHAVGSRGGTYRFGGWTNAVAGFADAGSMQSGDYLWVSFTGENLPPGRYRLGTLTFTSTLCTALSLVPEMPSFGNYTWFGTGCAGASGDHPAMFGRDFEDFCGTVICTGTETETWGMIKTRYRQARRPRAAPGEFGTDATRPRRIARRGRALHV